MNDKYIAVECEVCTHQQTCKYKDNHCEATSQWACSEGSCTFFEKESEENDETDIHD